MSISYELIGDGKKAKKIEIKETIINVEKKELYLQNLKDKINKLPIQKSSPDLETLELWNNSNQAKKNLLNHQIEQLEIEIDKIKGKKK